jgi:hypothetical protein
MDAFQASELLSIPSDDLADCPVAPTGGAFLVAFQLDRLRHRLRRADRLVFVGIELESLPSAMGWLGSTIDGIDGLCA